MEGETRVTEKKVMCFAFITKKKKKNFISILNKKLEHKNK